MNRVTVIRLFNFPVVASMSPGGWHMLSIVCRRQTLGEDADVSCQIERSTSDGIGSILICHKCLLFPMAIDKGQRTHEEHAFLMWHPHQTHHSGLSRMPMTLCSSSNYRQAKQQCACKLWRACLPPTRRRLSSSVWSALNFLLRWVLCGVRKQLVFTKPPSKRGENVKNKSWV